MVRLAPGTEPLSVLCELPTARLPATLEDSCVRIEVGAAIREVVDPIAESLGFDSQHKQAAEMLIASFFVPILAREDRMAAYLGLSRQKTRTMGRRLRAAGIWKDTRLTDDCYALLMDEDGFKANINLTLLAGVATAGFFAERGEGGEFLFSRNRPANQITVEVPTVCKTCSTSVVYTESGACVACSRKYAKSYKGPVRAEQI